MLQSVTFKEGSLLESIGESTFERCIALTSIINNDVDKLKVHIGDNAFTNCNKLDTDIISKVFDIIKLSYFIFLDKNKNADYIKKENELKMLNHPLLINSKNLKIFEQIKSLYNGYTETCEIVNGYNNNHYHVLERSNLKAIEIKFGEPVQFNSLNMEQSFVELVSFISKSENKNKKPYIIFEGQEGIDAGGLSKTLCGLFGEYLKKTYMTDISQKICVKNNNNSLKESRNNSLTEKEEREQREKEESHNNNSLKKSKESRNNSLKKSKESHNNNLSKDLEFDFKKKLFNVKLLEDKLLKDEKILENLSNVLYFFMFIMSPIRPETPDLTLNLNLSEFTLMILFDMFSRVGKKIKLSKYIEEIIQILSNSNSNSNSNSKPDKKYNDREFLTINNTTIKNTNNTNNKYIIDVNNMLFTYIGVLYSLDEAENYEKFIEDFIKTINTKSERGPGYIELPHITLLKILHQHLYGFPISDINLSDDKLIECYETINKHIKLLEQIGINIKKQLGYEPDDMYCFSNNKEVTLYELAYTVIQTKTFNINKEEFIKLIKFKGNPGKDVIEMIKSIIRSFDDIKLRYFIRFGTGNIIIPNEYIINVSDDVGFIKAHTCFNTIDIASFTSYISQNQLPKTIVGYKTYIEDKLFSLKILQSNDYGFAGGKRHINNNKFKKSKKVKKY